MGLWIDLLIAFERAYERNPRDDSLIARIYSFADWCKKAPRRSDAGHDPLTAVTVGFYEHISSHPAARDDMPRWFRMSEIMQNKLVFAYHIGEERYQQLLANMQRNRHKYVDRESTVSES
jgi:hypothetical protein